MTAWPRALLLAALTCAGVGGCESCWGARSVPQVRSGSSHKAPQRAKSASCPRYAPAVVLGRVRASAIDEASGLTVSPSSGARPETLYVHNDSGDSSRVFALDRRGTLRAIFDLGVLAIDWEDIASARVGGKALLFVGDVGDNWRVRSSIRVHRIAEPVLPEGAAAGGKAPTIRVGGVQSFELRYPDDAHDAEAILVDPRGRDLLVVTKTVRLEKTLVFRAPLAKLSTKSPLTLERVAAISVWRGHWGDRVSGGDFSPSGDLLVLRTYREALIWPRRGDEPVSALLSRPPCALKLHAEPQGEAIAVGRDGLYTLSEKTNQPLYFYRRLR